MPRLDGNRARRKRADHRRARSKAARRARARYLATMNAGTARYYLKHKEQHSGIRL